ncbi:MAG TPA: TonB-dependent receptor [Gammaproteobacteria bacterium]|jgi:outer membrane receptor protein involved in Fe transport|nr:TonB-dependent receptor [Gammaproteobacteria bacterium]
MRFGSLRTLFACLMAGVAFSPLAWSDDQPQVATQLGTVEVTATPMPEHLDTVPQSVDVISHDQLVAQGVTDLRSALELSAGVDIAPGGDGGPASAVPEFQGLREFDAFLLLVDGVPVGGAFNPDLASIDLNGVDRIEIIRGSAPVKYGATSFVGVINVIHVKAGAHSGTVGASFGSYGSSSVGVAMPLSGDGPVKQSVVADYTQKGYSDPRTGWDRSHILYRSATDTDTGELRLDLDGLLLHQKPASPRPLPDVGTELSPLVPADTNDNPSDARMDEDRVSLTLGKDTNLGWGEWSTTLADTFTHNHNIRGFIGNNITNDGTPNSDGFDQSQDRVDIYFDSHLTFEPEDDLKMVTGFSYLYGSGQEQSANFAYFIAPSGVNPPSSASRPVDERTAMQDTRKFFGLYAQTDWIFAPRWDFNVGLQLNHDLDSRSTTLFPTDPTLTAQSRGDNRDDTRSSGMVSLGYTAWQDGADDTVIYGNYRNTFKPAANDFGPEYKPTILQPETAQAYEIGSKGTLLQGGFDWEASLFLANMNNTVISTDVGGLPGTANGGQNRFQGAELDADWRFAEDWRWQTAYSYHDAHYRFFIDITPGGLVQDAGNRLEVSPHHLFATGVFYMPARGFTGNVLVRYTGQRFFDPENTVSTPAFVTWDAGIGYRFDRWSLDLQGRNLNDARNVVSNSELGNSESYILPARFIELSAALQL